MAETNLSHTAVKTSTDAGTATFRQLRLTKPLAAIAQIDAELRHRAGEGFNGLSGTSIAPSIAELWGILKPCRPRS
jgi:hypothetical protein